jgi:hypothetical protein
MVMGANAELVILSMGLALRDIPAAHFNEELPKDAPDWVKESALDIGVAHRLTDIWHEQQKVNHPRGKGKAKVARPGKRKVAPGEDSQSKERIPA